MTSISVPSRILAAGVLLPLGLVMSLTGCDGCDGDNGVPVDPPRIESFSVEPASIYAGESAELSWEVINASSIRISDDEGNDLDLSNASVDVGSIAIAPWHTTVFTLTAEGPEETESASAQVTLEVLEPDAPVVLAFSAQPDEIVRGEAVTLSWSTAAGDSMSIVDGDGTELDLGDQGAAEGTVLIHPEESTVFTLLVSGPGGEDEAQAEVSVLPAPVVAAFSADPDTPVLPGTDVTLEWVTEGALSVTILLDGEVFHETDVDHDGSLELFVERLTEVTLIASGHLDSQASATLTIPVIPVIESFSADATLVRRGDPVTFTWVTRGADLVRIDGPGGIIHQAVDEDTRTGEFTATINTGGTYRLKAESGTLDDISTISIDITDAPRIHEFVASPDLVTEGQVVTLSWFVQGASSLSLTVTGLGQVSLAGVNLENDQVRLTLAEPGEVIAILTASNAAGETEAQAAVEVLTVPSIDHLLVMPVRVGAGETVELSWQTSDAHSIRLDKNGADLGVPDGLTTGSTTDVVDSDSSYVLHAFNRLGRSVSSEEVTVVVGQPEIVFFSASLVALPPGGSTTLSWRAEGGSSLSLTLDGDEVCGAHSPTHVAQGECVVSLPEELGSYEYALEVENGAGIDSASLTLLVSDGPIITSFQADRDSLTVGEPLLVSWVVENDIAGFTPGLTLVDDLGNVYDLSTRDPNQGSIIVIAENTGERVFTLTAETPGTTASHSSIETWVVSAPEITLFQATPNSIDTEGGTIQPESTISWQTTHAVSLTLWEIDEDGSPFLALVDEDDADVVASGDWTVFPIRTTHYRLVARNELGFEVVAPVRVAVDSPVVASFTASPMEIVAGETITLQWVAERADSVELDPPFRQVSDGYLDISEVGERIDFQMSPLSGRFVDVPFPAGFSFPYYGQDETMVRISYFGHVSFQFSSNIGWGSAELPGTSAGAVMAAFWDHIRAKDEDEPHAFYVFGSDEDGQYMRIQWSDFELASFGERPSTLNIQMVLRDDGRFEFHYGRMEGVSERVDGAGASIGYESHDGSEGMSVTFREAVPGGLGYTGFVFNEPPLAGSGSLEVSPRTSTTYTLTAESSLGIDSQSVTVTVHQPARLRSVTYWPDEVQEGDDFEILYEVTRATHVEVLNDEGLVLCSQEVDPDLVETGSCHVEGRAAGTYGYLLEVTSVMEHHEVTRELEVIVYPVLEILYFEVDEQSVEVNEWVTFDWASVGGEKVELFIGTSPNVLSDDADPDLGSFSTLFHQTTEILLRVTGPYGRQREETITIFINAARIEELYVSEPVVSAGESVTLFWSTSNADEVGLQPARTEGSFVDIRLTGVQVSFSSTGSGHADIPFGGFVFPYYGEDRTEVRMMTNGFLSFEPAALSTWVNTELPSPSARSPIMAPFWDDLHLRGTGEGHYELFSTLAGDYMIIQWSSIQFFDYTQNPADLTFQVVLHENGTFEYRYSNMLAEGQSRANGAEATIGYEDDDGIEGHLLSFNTEVEGGLSNRGWRFDWHLDYGALDLEGSMEVVPWRTTTYTICATGHGWTECQDVTVEVEED